MVIDPDSGADPRTYHPSPWPWVVLLIAAVAIGFELWEVLNEPVAQVLMSL
jgi:hypothetical protein